MHPFVGYALPTCHAALGQAASAPRGAGGVAQASSLRGGILSTAVRCWPWPLMRRHKPGATTCLRAVSAFVPDRLDDRNKHIQHPCDQDG